MQIHHATRKKADAAGIALDQAPEGSDYPYKAYWAEEGKGEVEFFWGDASELVAAMLFAKTMTLNHPGLRFEQDDTGDAPFAIYFGPRMLGRVAEIADVASATMEALDGLTDPERTQLAEADQALQDEEDKRSGSVVPDVYKKRYAEAGHPGNCGDWLALTLEPYVTAKNGKLDPDAMEEIARLNGVDTSKLNRTTPGWQGRFRMTARNMMVKVIAKTGVLHIPASEAGDTITAPQDWMAANQPRVKEAGEKVAAKSGGA